MMNASRDLHVMAARMRATGQRDLRLQMTRGLRSVAKPLIDDARAAAVAKLPKGGGLNVQVAGKKMTVSVRTGARTAGVRLVADALDPGETNSGYVIHPTFGRRDKGQWKRLNRPAMAGWWSDTLTADAPKVTAALLVVMDTVAAEIMAV